jgi:hypothetical protein
MALEILKDHRSFSKAANYFKQIIQQGEDDQMQRLKRQDF